MLGVYMRVFLGILVIFVLFVACTPENGYMDYLPIDNGNNDGIDEDECAEMGAVLTEFPTACADFCYARREIQAICAQVVTESCDCGPGMCWTGSSCVPI